MKIDAAELEAVLGFMMVNQELNRIECNYCYAGNYIFSEQADIDLSSAASTVISHIQTHHAGRLHLEAAVDETEVKAAIDSILGLPQPQRKD